MIIMIRTSTVTNHIDADNTVNDIRNLMLWTLLTKARTALEQCKLECSRVLLPNYANAIMMPNQNKLFRGQDWSCLSTETQR